MMQYTPGSARRVIFHFIQEVYICNFADGNSLYSTEENFKEVKTIVKKIFKLVQVRFYENYQSRTVYDLSQL